MSNQKNIILFDWLSFTSKVHSPESIIDFLGLTNNNIKWVTTYGLQGYKDRLFFSGISIHYNHPNPDNVGCWVEMSGEGCRAFDEFADVDWSVIFCTICAYGQDYHLTRLDIAYDDKLGSLDIDKIYKQSDKCNFISKFKDCLLTKSARTKAITVQFGSNRSDVSFTIYDKSKERVAKTKCEDNLGHWIRFEILLRDNRALDFVKYLVDGLDIGTVFFGVINNYLRFVVPDVNQTNTSRLSTAKWWTKWLDTLESISIYTPCDLDYNLMRCEDYVYRQAGNALDTLIQIKGIDNVLSDLQANKPQKSPKYTDLINTCGLFKNSGVTL